MAKKLFDAKSWYGYSFWNTINRLVVQFQFDSIAIEGYSNLPDSGPFILVANHSSRWDGLVVQYLLNRRANYMVSPNEIKGIQAPAVLSVGAFPANPRLDLVGYSTHQLMLGEPVVIFPEGNVFYDGDLRRFKTGTAKIALKALDRGMDLKIIPLAIKYSFGSLNKLKMEIGSPLQCSEIKFEERDYREKVKELTGMLRGRVKKMLSRNELGLSASPLLVSQNV